MKESKLQKALLILIFLFNTSCVYRGINQKGNVFTKENLEEIKVGLSGRDAVIQELGFPFTISSFDENIWIYYTYQTKEFLFFQPKLENQKVLVLAFDSEGDTLKDLFLYDINTDNYEIAEITSEISTDDENNIIQDIIKNIGQVTM